MEAGGAVRNTEAVTPPEELAENVAKGARVFTVAKMAAHLLRRRIDPFVALELLRGWNMRCSPPLPAVDIERTVDHVAGRELKRRGVK